MKLQTIFNLLAEFNGTNHAELAKKYSFTTATVYRLVNLAGDATKAKILSRAMSPFTLFFGRLVELLGAEKAAELVREFSGQTIQFPAGSMYQQPESFRFEQEVSSDERVLNFKVHVPSGFEARLHQRDQEILSAWSGNNSAELAQHYGLSLRAFERAIYRAVKGAKQ